jgi:hypothetical protein
MFEDDNEDNNEEENDEDEEEEDENNSTEEDEEEYEEEEITQSQEYTIISNMSIPSKPEIKNFVLKGQYVYVCVKTTENPDGEIDWHNSVGVMMGSGKIIYTMTYKQYEGLIVKT